MVRGAELVSAVEVAATRRADQILRKQTLVYLLFPSCVNTTGVSKETWRAAFAASCACRHLPKYEGDRIYQVQ